ncbi:MAG: hypothetical protein ABGW78_13220, partial [Pirellulales bacterium]
MTPRHISSLKSKKTDIFKGFWVFAGNDDSCLPTAQFWSVEALVERLGGTMHIQQNQRFFKQSESPRVQVSDVRICCFLAICVLHNTAYGQTSSPSTIWSFLGIGAAQNSANPAIKAAAKAKAAKHAICKKKKALEYLANMGCSPEHPEVGPALLAAMGDPDEPVRYAAVKAVYQTASECQDKKQKKNARKAIGCLESCHDWKKKIEKKFCECIDRIFGKAPPKERKCKDKLEECCEKLKSACTGKKQCVDHSKENCPCGDGRGPCCSPDMKEKLKQLAFGRDEKGCFLEPSERVRQMAELALQACQACAGCQSCGMGMLDQVVRELPAVTEREMAPEKAGDYCVTDRAVIAVPESSIAPLNAPTPAPEKLLFPTQPEPLPTPLPEPLPSVPMKKPQSLPTPAAGAQVPQQSMGPLRSVLVREQPRSRWSKQEPRQPLLGQSGLRNAQAQPPQEKRNERFFSAGLPFSSHEKQPQRTKKNSAPQQAEEQSELLSRHARPERFAFIPQTDNHRPIVTPSIPRHEDEILSDATQSQTHARHNPMNVHVHTTPVRETVEPQFGPNHTVDAVNTPETHHAKRTPANARLWDIK